ncbi:family S53 protease-like protein [Irpex rosettiformis]|uniref:Family S53 protease-like protein n=1 Tax=Irpex rosettiformis TaxID=378272 RepID=A0ACB8TVD8_9APHY|nr:family S53 protease-like protein [Irpex rosettiformis]
MVSKLLVLSALCSLAVAKPHTRNLAVHEAVATTPRGYVRTAPATSDSNIKLRIALAPKDIDGLITTLYDVSDPKSTLYGAHLTKEEAEAFVSPTSETVEKVNEWLKENGVTATPLTDAGDWLSVQIPISKANEMLNADFSVFTHPTTNKQVVRTLTYSIPDTLKGHIDVIHPTITFPNPRGRHPVVHSVSTSNDTRRATCSSSGITPACVQSLYGVPATIAKNSKSRLAVSGFIEQFAQQKDLTTFLQKFRPDLPSTTAFTLQTLDGGQNPQGNNQAGVEANLDIQYTVGIASGIPTTFISVGANNQDGDLVGSLDMINFLLNESNPPQVLTTSYDVDEPAVSRALTNTLCNACAQLGARGVSILFASGDGGVGGSEPGESCTTFIPTSPNNCPFVTNVGATQLSGTSSETSAGLSSGGFSNYFGIPYYQASAVQSFLKTLGSTDSGKFNRSGRAIPDVAAIGTNLEIVVNGRTELVNGTSCSSPIFASIVALLNDELLAAGKSPLGFLNPFLYANPGAFNDITTGSNPGCNTSGFPAVKGWDPVTGLGTPNFARLRKAAGLS